MKTTKKKTNLKLCSRCLVTKGLSEFWCSPSSQKHVAACNACRAERATKAYKQNREKLLTYAKKYREDPSNIPRIRAHQKQYKICKRRGTPSWLNQRQKNQIVSFYNLAQYYTKTTGIEHQVDHIVPLQGVDVCGLHVPWNLQVLSKPVNIMKSNRTDLYVIPRYDVDLLATDKMSSTEVLDKVFAEVKARDSGVDVKTLMNLLYTVTGEDVYLDAA